MSEPSVIPAMRSAGRRMAAPEAGPFSVPIPVGPIGTASNVVVTITADAELNPDEVRNAAERAVRIAAKARGLDMAAFLTLLEALAAVARHKKAEREAKDRISQLLAGSRSVPATDPQAKIAHPLSQVSTPLTLENRNE